MDGSFKNIARITLVLTVGLLAATGVGPQFVTQATQALTNAKPAQDAAYALQTFFDRFAPAQSDDIQPDQSNTADIRLASTSSPAFSPASSPTASPTLVAPLPFRLITAATADEFPGFHRSILRLVGVTSPTRLSRFAFATGENAILVIACNDPAS